MSMSNGNSPDRVGESTWRGQQPDGTTVPATLRRQLNVLFAAQSILFIAGGLLGGTARLLGCVFLLPGFVAYALLIYKLWKLVPRQYARGSAGLMAVMSVVPIWMFPAFLGLGRALNAETAPEKKVNEELCLTACLAFCFMCVGAFVNAYISMLCSLTACALLIICCGQMKTAASILLQRRR